MTQDYKGEADWQRVHRLRRYGVPTTPLFPDPRRELAPDWTRVDEDSAWWIAEEMNRHVFDFNGRAMFSGLLGGRFVTVHQKTCPPCHVRRNSLSGDDGNDWIPREFCCA